MQAFAEAPAIVAAALDAIHLFPRLLADVADPEVRAVEAPSPGVTKTVGVDFLAERPAARRSTLAASAAGERIVGRNLVSAVAAHIDADHLAEQSAAVLRVVVGIAAAAA